VKRIIKSGIVFVDSEVETDPAVKILSSQQVDLEGSTIKANLDRYFMLNKPAGFVSATKDQNHPTAISLIYEHRNERLQIAGRLDIDTTGLLIITDDGKWNHRLTSPKSNCQKFYKVTLLEPILPCYQHKLAKGLLLDGEKHRCLPAQMNQIDSHSLTLSIREGKYHQVKRMFSALGNNVQKLHRYKIGDIVLDHDLAEGEYRPLSKAEVASIP
jgi:16S rRNA pseudouridine516 synthase